MHGQIAGYIHPCLRLCILSYREHIFFCRGIVWETASLRVYSLCFYVPLHTSIGVSVNPQDIELPTVQRATLVFQL